MLTNRWNWRGKGQVREGRSQVGEEKLGAKEVMSEGQHAAEGGRAVSDEFWDARREAAQ